MAYDSEGNYYESPEEYATRVAAEQEAARLKALEGKYDSDGVYHPLTMDGTDHQASNATATLARSKYDDWKLRFFPKVDELMNMTTYMNKELVPTETANAVKLTNQSFDTVTAGQDRNVARFGMTQTAEQKAAQDSALSLGRSTATVGAENNTRIALKDRDRAIATGGLGGTV
jgi:hypothetical protein